MDRVRLPGTDVEISALCLGVAEIGVRQTETEAIAYWTTGFKKEAMLLIPQECIRTGSPERSIGANGL